MIRVDHHLRFFLQKPQKYALHKTAQKSCNRILVSHRFLAEQMAFVQVLQAKKQKPARNERAGFIIDL